MQDIFAVLFLAMSTGKIPSIWALGLVALFPARRLLMYYMTRAGHGELLILYGLALAFGAWALFDLVGMKGDLGVLFIGALLAAHPAAAEMSKKLMSFKDLLLVGFFLSIGMAGDITIAALLVALLLAGPLLLVYLPALHAPFYLDDASAITGDTGYTGDEGDVVVGDMDAIDVEGLTDTTYFTVSSDATNGTAIIDAETGPMGYINVDDIRELDDPPSAVGEPVTARGVLERVAAVGPEIVAPCHQGVVSVETRVPGSNPRRGAVLLDPVCDVEARAGRADDGARAAAEALAGELIPHRVLLLHLENVGKVCHVELELEGFLAAAKPGQVITDVVRCCGFEEVRRRTNDVVALRGCDCDQEPTLERCQREVESIVHV